MVNSGPSGCEPMTWGAPSGRPGAGDVEPLGFVEALGLAAKKPANCAWVAPTGAAGTRWPVRRWLRDWAVTPTADATRIAGCRAAARWIRWTRLHAHTSLVRHEVSCRHPPRRAPAAPVSRCARTIAHARRPGHVSASRHAVGRRAGAQPVPSHRLPAATCTTGWPAARRARPRVGHDRAVAPRTMPAQARSKLPR